MTRTTRQVHVTDPSGVAAARRVAIECAQAAKLGETAVGRAALVATELATNIVKHGSDGSILFTQEEPDVRAMTILAVDRGRGFTDVPAALRDGYSTAGSPGNGLGAIDRASVELDVFTVPGKGSAISCRVQDGEQPERMDGLILGGVCVAVHGETEPGDAWDVMTDGTTTVLVADGLGHGPVAAEASNAATRVLRERPGQSLELLMQDMHTALRPTRGAAVAMARIDPAAGRLDYVGVGNISAAILSDEQRVKRAVSQNGIVGHEMRRVQTVPLPWSPSSVLIMTSDGISTSWNLDAYPGLVMRHPSMIAAVLFRDHARGTDDATVVVAKPR